MLKESIKLVLVIYLSFIFSGMPGVSSSVTAYYLTYMAQNEPTPCTCGCANNSAEDCCCCEVAEPAPVNNQGDCSCMIEQDMDCSTMPGAAHVTDINFKFTLNAAARGNMLPVQTHFVYEKNNKDSGYKPSIFHPPPYKQPTEDVCMEQLSHGVNALFYG